jgi:dihydrofolate synthase/folylpolyglutamate synthase
VRDIAREKLAVVRPGATLVLGADLDADAVAEAASTPAGRVVTAPADVGVDVGALGAFQRRNFALARTAAEALLGPLDENAVRQAAGAIRVPGRFQVVDQNPLTIVDGAHNPGGMRALAESLADHREPLVVVLSVLDDKDAAAMLSELVPLCDGIVCTSNANPRALSPATLASLTEQLDGPPTRLEPDPRKALQLARELAGPDGAVMATGSIYLVADLLRPQGATGPRSRL